MGKIRRNRQKLHMAAARSQQDQQPPQHSMDVTMDTHQTSKASDISPSDNVFSKLQIDINALQRQLTSGGSDIDQRSAVTSKSLRGMGLKKKEKRDLKHQLWMKKVDVIQAVKQEEKAKKKRKQTAVVGDMKPLADTLPTLELLLRDTTTPSNKAKANKGVSHDAQTKPKAVKKEKTRKKEMLEDISLFQQVLTHPAFKSNPLSTIKEHLTNKLKQEDAMDS